MLLVAKLKVVFGTKVILNKVDLLVRRGEVVALVGSNGAGKSTLVGALAGIHKIKEGEIRINDKPIDKIKSELGFIPQHPSYMSNVKVKELLRLYSSFYINPLHFEELIELGLLREMLQKKTQELSGGERKRLAFALAMLGRPKVLIADEPTSGMDIEMKSHFYKMLQSYLTKGIAIILVTHLEEELEILAHRIVELENGMLTNKAKLEVVKG